MNYLLGYTKIKVILKWLRWLCDQLLVTSNNNAHRKLDMLAWTLSKADEVLVRQGIYCYIYLSNTNIFPQIPINYFSTQLIKPLYIPGSPFWFIKIKHIFNIIVHSRQNRIIPHPIFPPCVCHLCCPLHVFFWFSNVLKNPPLTFLKLNYCNNFNDVIHFSCDPMKYIMVAPLSNTQDNNQKNGNYVVPPHPMYE